MSKFLIGGIAFIIVFLGIIWLYKNYNAPNGNIFSQSIVPTSTSAPTPTSIYKRSMRQTQPVAADTVTLTKTGFSPQVLTIKRGQTVTWMNNSGNQATVNSNPHPTHTDYPPLNLGEFNDGDILQLRFPKPGTYGYHNHFDATQTGTIVVE